MTTHHLAARLASALALALATATAAHAAQAAPRQPAAQAAPRQPAAQTPPDGPSQPADGPSPPAAPAPAAAPWQPVAPAVLAAVRGGWTTPTGLALSLGIERVASINGTLVAQTSIRLDDVRNISADQAAQARAALGATTLVQNNQAGVGAVPGLPPGTYIQNSLNGQNIGNLTTINASVNSASILKLMNFQASVRDAGIAALRPH